MMVGPAGPAPRLAGWKNLLRGMLPRLIRTRSIKQSPESLCCDDVGGRATGYKMLDLVFVTNDSMRLVA